MSGGVWEGWRFVGGAWEGVSYVGGVDVCGRCDGRVRCVGVVKVCGTVLDSRVAYVMCPHAPL